MTSAMLHNQHIPLTNYNTQCNSTRASCLSSALKKWFTQITTFSNLMDTYIKRYSMELASATQNVGLFTLLQLIGGIVQKQQSGGTLVGIPQMALQTKNHLHTTTTTCHLVKLPFKPVASVCTKHHTSPSCGKNTTLHMTAHMGEMPSIFL